MGLVTAVECSRRRSLPCVKCARRLVGCTSPPTHNTRVRAYAADMVGTNGEFRKRNVVGRYALPFMRSRARAKTPACDGAAVRKRASRIRTDVECCVGTIGRCNQTVIIISEALNLIGIVKHAGCASSQCDMGITAVDRARDVSRNLTPADNAPFVQGQATRPILAYANRSQRCLGSAPNFWRVAPTKGQVGPDFKGTSIGLTSHRNR